MARRVEKTHPAIVARALVDLSFAVRNLKAALKPFVYQFKLDGRTSDLLPPLRKAWKALDNLACRADDISCQLSGSETDDPEHLALRLFYGAPLSVEEVRRYLALVARRCGQPAAGAPEQPIGEVPGRIVSRLSKDHQ